MGRPKGSKNKPKHHSAVVETPKLPAKSTKPTNNKQQPSVPKTVIINYSWKAPDDFIVTAIPKEQWEKLKPGTRVKTHSTCVVGGLVFTGTIISRDPNSEFLRVNWDVKGSQAAHWKTITPSGSPLENLPKPPTPSLVEINPILSETKSVATFKPSGNFKLPEQLPEQPPKRRGRPPGSKNKVKHK
jgi:hypothetical protein